MTNKDYSLQDVMIQQTYRKTWNNFEEKIKGGNNQNLLQIAIMEHIYGMLFLKHIPLK